MVIYNFKKEGIKKMFKCFKDKLLFWLWAKDIELRIKNNPLGSFAFMMQKEVIYKKILNKEGFEAVLREHEKYVDKLKRRISQLPLP